MNPGDFIAWTFGSLTAVLTVGVLVCGVIYGWALYVELRDISAAERRNAELDLVAKRMREQGFLRRQIYLALNEFATSPNFTAESRAYIYKLLQEIAHAFE